MVNEMENKGINKPQYCFLSGDCCPNEDEVNFVRQKIVIDFLYLDLSVCDRCQGAEHNLDQALREVAKVLETTGTDVAVNKITVNTKELAIAHKFLSSPTIRINGRDLQPDYQETLCESCDDLYQGEVKCRVWDYQGKQYTNPPKGMIVEAILKAVYGGLSQDIEEQEYVVPDNLVYVFSALEAKMSKE